MSISDQAAAARELESLSSVPNVESTQAGERESKAQFRELMAHLQQVFWLKDAADTAVLYVSPAYEKIWGRARTGLYDGSHTFLDSVHPDDRHRMTKAMSQKIESEGHEEEYRIVRPDGTLRWIWARTYPVRNERGEIKRYAGIAEDVSERKWAEKERARLVAIIEHTDDAIISITLDGTIVAWNQGAERKYGYTAGEIIGSSIYVLIPSDRCDQYMKTLKRLAKGEQVPAYETVRTRKDGTQINLSVGLSPIESRDGEIVGVSKIGHELGQVRKLEAQLIESQKMEVVGQLTGGVAHDFNNILSVVLGYTELMLGEEKLDDLLRRPLDIIRLAAMRGVGLVRQLLVFSRKEKVHSVVLDLNKVVEGLQDMLRPLLSEGIELVVSQGPRLGRIKADAGYIGQVLMNLVVNARDAMPYGGQIFISTSNVSLAEARGGDQPNVAGGDHVMVSVRDTGCGMSNQTIARAFEPFFTTKPKGKGTGLGLATCQTIVHQSGGHIEVYSEINKGTTFKIYFPRVTQHQVGSTPSLFGPSELPGGDETVLVVEDDPGLRRLIGEVLQGRGYRVLTAANGEEGLLVASENQGAVIRLVITDIIMPRMSGKEMAERLGAKNPELKILFTSGHQEEVETGSGLLEKNIAFLAKPYSLATLTRNIRELLDSAPLPIPAPHGLLN